MKLTTIQKICLAIIFTGTIFHIVRHFAPSEVVEWAMQPDSPLWATIFNNTPTYNWFGYECSKWAPLVIQAVAATYVLLMYRVVNYVNVKFYSKKEMV